MQYHVRRIQWSRLVLVLGITCLLVRQLWLLPNNQDEQAESEKTSNSRASSKYAYASLIGGVGHSSSYRGFFYNILVATKLLRMFGSKADFVIFIQLSHDNPLQELPKEEVAILKASNVIIQYIPKSNHQSFYEITLEKFRILQLTHYERVLFLDADVMPLANLDYLFDMSANASLKENLVVAGTQEPSTAGFFLLAPKLGAIEQLQQIIQRREVLARDLPFPKFDVVQGWGHAIRPPDRWETTLDSRYGTNWTFYSADADQGLLYFYTKYHQQKVSIVIGNRVQNWIPGPDGMPRLESTLERPFQNTTKRIRKWAVGPPPYCHFFHFTGKSKPWEGRIPTNLTEYNHRKSPSRFWFYHLLQINQEVKLFDANNWEAERAKITFPPLGRFHVKADMAQRVDRANKVI